MAVFRGLQGASEARSLEASSLALGVGVPVGGKPAFVEWTHRALQDALSVLRIVADGHVRKAACTAGSADGGPQ